MEELAKKSLELWPAFVIPLLAILGVCYFAANIIREFTRRADEERVRATLAHEKLTGETIIAATKAIGECTATCMKAMQLLELYERRVNGRAQNKGANQQ